MDDTNVRTMVYRAKPSSSSSSSSSTTTNALPSTFRSKMASEKALLVANKLARDRKKAQNVCRSVLLGLCVFFLLVVSSMFSFKAQASNLMHLFGMGTSFDDRRFDANDNTRHTTHLKANLNALGDVPFQHRVFHRDLTQLPGESPKEEEFVYGRPVPGMHSSPLPHREVLNGVELLWQIPPPPMRIKYIMFLFHGCGRRAMSFYYSPEGIAIVQSLLSNNYAIAAVSKQDDEHGCWAHSTTTTAAATDTATDATSDADTTTDGQLDETAQVAGALRLWKKRLHDIPHWDTRTSHVEPVVHGFGASSGGHFLVHLATDERYKDLNFQAVHVQVAAPQVSPLALWTKLPVYFTIMSRDWTLKSHLQRLAVQLKEMQVPHHIHECKSLQITLDYFRQRVPDVSRSLSGAMYRTLLSQNIVNPKGDLLMDPRELDHGIGPLVSFVHGGKRAPPGVSEDLLRILTPNELARSQVVWIAEELNVAWDLHEINGDGIEHVLEWLAQQDGYRVGEVV